VRVANASIVGHNGRRLFVKVDGKEIYYQVTRSIGHGNCDPKGALIPDPFVTKVDIDDNVLALVVGSDGLFDAGGSTYNSIHQNILHGANLGLDLDELVEFVAGVGNGSDDSTTIIRAFDKFEKIRASDSYKRMAFDKAQEELDQWSNGCVWQNLSLDDAKERLHNEYSGLLRAEDDRLYVTTVAYKWDDEKDVSNNLLRFFLEDDQLVWLKNCRRCDSLRDHLKTYRYKKALEVWRV
jgi:hypothetical protein